MIDKYKYWLYGYEGNSKSLNKRLNTIAKTKGFDKVVNLTHNQVFDEVDCLECANCCKTTGPLLTASDIAKIASKQKVSEREFISKYLRKDDDGDMVFKSMPCPFLLDDNRCGIYEYRPRACRRYPHTDEKGQKAILHLTRKNAKICPAVSKIVQVLAEL